MLGGCPRVSGGRGTARLEEVIAFISQVSPNFSKVEKFSKIRAELDMGPKSKPECSRKRGWGPWPELEDKGGSLVSCLAQPAKDQASYLKVQLGSLSQHLTSTSSQHMVNLWIWICCSCQ